jgi:hypothetical protein
LVDIEDYNPDIIDIYSKDVLEMIKHGYSGWEDMVPSYVDTIIKDNRLFEYDPSTSPDPNYIPPSSRQKQQRVNPH